MGPTVHMYNTECSVPNFITTKVLFGGESGAPFELQGQGWMVGGGAKKRESLNHKTQVKCLREVYMMTEPSMSK